MDTNKTQKHFSVIMNSELSTFDYHGPAHDTATAVYRCSVMPRPELDPGTRAPLGDYTTIVVVTEDGQPPRIVAGLVTVEADSIAIPNSFFDGPKPRGAA